MVSIEINNSIRRLIKAAEEDQEVLTEETRALLSSSEPCSSATIRWPLLKSIVEDLNRKGGGYLLHELCKGSNLSFPQPPPRPPRPKELDERNKILQDRLDEKQYQGWVADVTQKERAANELREEAALLPTFWLQVGFTMHLIVTMGTFYAIFYVASIYVGVDRIHPVWTHLAGVAGLTFGLLLETFLLIIRSNRPERMNRGRENRARSSAKIALGPWDEGAKKRL
jgi:hypothetical protein